MLAYRGLIGKFSALLDKLDNGAVYLSTNGDVRANDLRPPRCIGRKLLPLVGKRPHHAREDFGRTRQGCCSKCAWEVAIDVADDVADEMHTRGKGGAV